MNRLPGIKIPSIVAVAMAVVASYGASADQSGYDQHMMGWGGWLSASIMMLVGLAILVGFIAVIVRLAMGRGSAARPQENAMEILRARFAKGEIGKEEFEQMKRNLEAG